MPFSVPGVVLYFEGGKRGRVDAVILVLIKAIPLIGQWRAFTRFILANVSVAVRIQLTECALHCATGLVTGRLMQVHELLVRHLLILRFFKCGVGFELLLGASD